MDVGSLVPRLLWPAPTGAWERGNQEGYLTLRTWNVVRPPGEVTAVACSQLESQPWQISAAALLGPIQSLLLPISYQSTAF